MAYLGPKFPRQPFKYGPALLEEHGTVCAWPLCRKSLYLPVYVDHNHKCCSHEFCCAFCPRGVVHALCNNGIMFIELYRDDLGLPDDVVEYLDHIRDVPLQSSMSNSDRYGGWAARRGIPSRPPNSGERRRIS